MSNPSTSRPTSRHTGRSEPLSLISWTLETDRDGTRLTVTGGPLRGVCQTHTWRLTAETLTAGLLDEIGAAGASLAQSALLSALGVQLELAFELQEAQGPL